MLDYIYAVLHNPTYCETYKELLKIDFPRVPYPNDPGIFWQLVALGKKLRQIHLLETPQVNNFITSYPVDGDNRLTRRLTKHSPGFELTNKVQNIGRIWINDTQYFNNIPLLAWNSYIGNYQPARKWLKDRRGRILSFEEILHYQKIIVILTETDQIIKKINDVGWK